MITDEMVKEYIELQVYSSNESFKIVDEDTWALRFTFGTVDFGRI
jgi:hypothetical protein